MDLKTLQDTPPWAWPESAKKTFRRILSDDKAVEPDRLIAAELAGDPVVIDDELAGLLLSIVSRGDQTEQLRAKAVISLGPVLELADIEGFDEDPVGDPVPISEQTFHRINKTLHQLYEDHSIPKLVRRRILEASVRSPQEWHREAIGAAYLNEDNEWKLTAVFAMRYVKGFDDQILGALKSSDSNIHYAAVLAAGNWEVDAAWPHVTKIINSKECEKGLLLAAIEAAANIRPQEAASVLDDLTESDDEEIAEAAQEAIELAQMTLDMEDDDEEAEDDDPRGWIH